MGEMTKAKEGRPMDVLDEIRAERIRQVTDEGFTAEHDDKHTDRSLVYAASTYAWAAAAPDATRSFFSAGFAPLSWPETWSSKWWKPTTRRGDLIKAAALIVAEIEMLDRL